MLKKGHTRSNFANHAQWELLRRISEPLPLEHVFRVRLEGLQVPYKAQFVKFVPLVDLQMPPRGHFAHHAPWVPFQKWWVLMILEFVHTVKMEHTLPFPEPRRRNSVSHVLLGKLLP